MRRANKRYSANDNLTREQRLNLCRKWLRKNTHMYVDNAEGEKVVSGLLMAHYPFQYPEIVNMATALWVASNEIVANNRGWARKERQKSKVRHKGRAKPKGMEAVYAVGEKDARFIKIGRSSNLKRRLAALQTSHHAPLYVYHVFYTRNMNLENQLHKRFRDYRSEADNEWFRVEGDVADWLEEYGDPIPVKDW